MKYYILVSVLFLASCSCNDTKHKVKETIEDGGELLGKTAGTFGKGVSKGVEETFTVNISVSDQLTASGIELGKVVLESDSTGKDNVLNVYIIFNKAFDHEVSLKVYDSHKREMGRSHKHITASEDSAAYFDFHFDPRTNIDSDSKIIME